MTAQVCPRCGQPLSTRYGVALSPVRLRLFDLIERKPGITSAQIAAALYPERELKTARRTIFTDAYRPSFCELPISRYSTMLMCSALGKMPATGAIIAAEAQRRRGGYYWWRQGCYVQRPDGAFVRVSSRYC